MNGLPDSLPLPVGFYVPETTGNLFHRIIQVRASIITKYDGQFIPFEGTGHTNNSVSKNECP